MVKAKKFVLQKHFEGLPKTTDLKLVEEELPPIKDGEYLAEAVFLSVDPYMRAYALRLPLGSTFNGAQVAKIIESKEHNYPVGKYVVGNFGWRTHTIANGKPTETGRPLAWLIPEPEELPLSYFLGILGTPGITAYFGFLEICKPQSGETVAVSGAAGAIGSIVGQIAKINGCTVIAIAGSDEKGQWLTEELKFDNFVNYKEKDFKKKLKEVTSEGIDCYFDNVGGEITSHIVERMNMYGRISVCGASAGYNDDVPQKVRPIQPFVVGKQLKVQGFIAYRWYDRWFEGINQNKQWIKEGKMKYRETITEGFENMTTAFVDMLQGRDVGKAVVKV